MKRQIGTVLAVVLLLTVLLGGAGPTGAQSGAPTVVSYQGQVTVGGAAYTGAGYFKFAVVDQAGTTTYWSNDGTSVGGSEPTAAVQLNVSNGLFNVLLGDTALTHMTALPASAFDGTERYLRVWFSSDGATFTLLAPDRRVAAAPYALQAEEVRNGWRLTGNTGTTPATHFVGTTDAQPLVFRTNNVERMRLDTNGRLGLGSLPGTQRLTIRGIGTFSDWIQFQDDGGINQWHLNYSGGGFNFVESGVSENRLFLQDGGNVGIGTNDPQARLDVAGSIRTNGQLVSTVGAGTAPLAVASATQVTNLNADLLDGQHATAFAVATHDHDATYVNEGQVDSISSAMIINGTISFGDVGQNGCANGQVMQWNGTAWACASVMGVTDHGALAGLGDDDHPQYFHLSQAETVTGIPAFNGGTSGTSAPFTVDSTYGVTNLNADLLDGQHASAFAAAAHDHDAAYVNEGQADSVTSAMIVNGTVDSGDLADGATLAEILDDDGAASGLDADLLDGLHASAFQQHYDNYIVVAKSGGDFATIGAALASITDASDTNRYLVKVMPGVYTERVTMKPYVDIEGAGELTTKITYSGSDLNNTGTLVGAHNAELRFLTVANTGGDDYAIAIYNSSASPRLTHITASGSGGTYENYGVYNDTSSPTMTDVTAMGSGGMDAHGVYNDSSSPTMTGVTATGSGGAFNFGVYNYFSSPLMTNVSASASGAYSCGLMNNRSSATIQNSVIRASGGESYGVYNTTSSGSCTVRVNNCQITGGTRTIVNGPGFTTLVGASLLDGGAVNAGGGTVTCAGVYDENYAFYASTCP